MRFHNPLDDVIANPIQLKVLRQLHKSPKQGLTGRELARRCSASPSQTIRGLLALESAGAVTREIAGPSHVWRLARGHVWFVPLAKLFEEEAAVFTELRAALGEAVKGLPVEKATLFGSIARGDEQSSSDIDLYIEVRTDQAKSALRDSLSAASARFAVRFGNSLSSLIVTRDQIRHGTHSELRRVVEREGLSVTS